MVSDRLGTVSEDSSGAGSENISGSEVEFMSLTLEVGMEIKMGRTWFPLTRGRIRKTRQRLRAYGLTGLESRCKYGAPNDDVAYWVAVLLMHS